MTLGPEDCITCSDEAVEAEVVRVQGLSAVVRVGPGEVSVAIDLVPGAAPGDRLLCHAGIALDTVLHHDDVPQVAQSHEVRPALPAGAARPAVSASSGEGQPR